MLAVMRAVPEPPTGMLAGEAVIDTDTGFCAWASTAAAKQIDTAKKAAAKKRIKSLPQSFCVRAFGASRQGSCSNCRCVSGPGRRPHPAPSGPVLKLLDRSARANIGSSRQFNNIQLGRTAQLDSPFRPRDANRPKEIAAPAPVPGFMAQRAAGASSPSISQA